MREFVAFKMVTADAGTDGTKERACYSLPVISLFWRNGGIRAQVAEREFLRITTIHAADLEAREWRRVQSLWRMSDSTQARAVGR